MWSLVCFSSGVQVKCLALNIMEGSPNGILKKYIGTNT